MEYKFCCSSNQLVVLIGCVLATIVSADITAGNIPTALTVKEQSCCLDTDVLSTSHHGCFNQTANVTYKVVLNCTQHYLIYKELEVEVHVNPKGALVDGNYEVEWAE